MKPVNIQSLIHAKASLNEDTFASYAIHYDIDLKHSELQDLGAFVSLLKTAGLNASDFDGFHVGYKIPQIGKEFDLLRAGQQSIVNVELKSVCAVDKIKAQLLRNRYYLSFTGREIHAFTFVSTTGDLHFLDKDGELNLTTPSHLLEVITKQAPATNEILDSLFSPSDYLVSPFNSTDKFLAGEYFLTHQQEEIKTQVLASISPTERKLFSITGSAGTGKTLLTFDIARQLYANGKKVLIIHAGLLNDGHYALLAQGWKIVPIKNYKLHDFGVFDLVIVDEAQRVTPIQLDDIVSRISAAKRACIFSYDKAQTLSAWEAAKDTAGKIGAIPSITSFKLSEKIRTNKEIASFIKALFNCKAPIQVKPGESVSLTYFNNITDAKSYLQGLDQTDWKVLRFTPSQYNSEHHESYFDAGSKTSHQVIGQEFDNVAIAVDQFFSYDDAGNLTYQGKAYYAPTKMLFQNITRARRRLNLVLIGNQAVLSRCLSILK